MTKNLETVLPAEWLTTRRSPPSSNEQFVDRNHLSIAETPATPLCAASGCTDKIKSRINGQAYCGIHWQRVYRYGTTELIGRLPRKVCVVEGCQARGVRRGYCDKHHNHLKRWGSVDGRSPAPLIELAALLGVSKMMAHHILYPERRAARDAVLYAIRTGLMVRPTTCSKCGRSDPDIEGHHDDYSKRLEVRWLCKPCHVVDHPRIGRSTHEAIRRLEAYKASPAFATRLRRQAAREQART